MLSKSKHTTDLPRIYSSKAFSKFSGEFSALSKNEIWLLVKKGLLEQDIKSQPPQIIICYLEAIISIKYFKKYYKTGIIKRQELSKIYK